jgi:hypothetical protein
VKNEEELQRVDEERNILQTKKRMKADWIGYILRRKCLLKKLLTKRYKGREDEEKNVSSYWMTSRKGDGIEI